MDQRSAERSCGTLCGTSSHEFRETARLLFITKLDCEKKEFTTAPAFHDSEEKWSVPARARRA